MNTELPLYGQEKRNTCALACLRMALARFGTNIEESLLESQARMEPDGTDIGELERLARLHGLVAEIQFTTIADLRRILGQGELPIAFIDRAIFDLSPARRAAHSLRDSRIHTVIPTRVTAASVTFHDPLLPRIYRKSIRLFERAHFILGGACVVCAKK